MSTKPAAPPAPSPPPAAPPPPQAARSPKATVPQFAPVKVSSGPITGSDGIVVFGTEGIGKTTLAAWLPSPFFADVEKSTRHMNVSRDEDLFNSPTFPLLRSKVAAFAHSPIPGARSFVLDTATTIEKLIADFVVDTRPAMSDRGTQARSVASIEDYGWGKGWQYVAEEFEALLADLDRIRARGLFVCLICHAVASPFVNPLGEDYVRYEPHLYSGDKNRRGSIRDRVRQWADHVLFVGYDVHVTAGGKGIGSGSRQIYTYELPTHVAKSRTAQVIQPFDIQDPSAIWRTLGVVTDGAK